VHTVIVDAANVIGSVPDGWWRDRRGAARRLRDALAPLAATGLADLPGPLQIILVVEGAARGLDSIPGVRVEEAPRSGDDKIVQLVRDLGLEDVVVVTADRGLRERVGALGARVIGPKSVPRG
jgi:hypothetical protein